jgi:hypothetical protein
MNIDEQLNILEKYGLNPIELFIINLIFLTQEGYEEPYLLRYLKIPENKENFRPTLLKLQDKGIILKSYKIPEKGSKFDPLEIPLNQNFFKTFWKSSFELGKELFETYPMFVNINGITYSLRSIAKKFNSLEDFYRFYGKSISWNLDKHKEIIDLINWEQQNNVGFLRMSLSSFVIEQKWNELKALKDGDVANINFDTLVQI